MLITNISKLFHFIVCSVAKPFLCNVDFLLRFFALKSVTAHSHVVICKLYIFGSLNWGAFSGVEERAREGMEPPKSLIFFKIRAYKTLYSVAKGYFRFEKLSSNRYLTRYREVKLRYLLDNTIIFLCK